MSSQAVRPPLLPSHPLYPSVSPWRVRTVALGSALGDVTPLVVTWPSFPSSDIKLPGQPASWGSQFSPPWSVRGDWDLQPSSWGAKYSDRGVQRSRWEGGQIPEDPVLLHRHLLPPEVRPILFPTGFSLLPTRNVTLELRQGLNTSK